MRCLILAFFLYTFPMIVMSQTEILLYENAVPNSLEAVLEEKANRGEDGILRVSQVTQPTLTLFTPDKSIQHTGKAIIICPGGGYGILAMTHEGFEVGEAFAAQGITAFVLKYRLPNDAIMEDKSIGPLQDAQRAIQLVRERASEWGIDPNQIGIAGFSAGGHLAATLTTRYHDVKIANPNNTSLRPDFALLAYPVISLDNTITHAGTRYNLLGESPSDADVDLFSNELQVTSDTPPAFLMHAEDDKAVPIENSLRFRTAMNKHAVPVELYTFPKGGHGFGLRNKTSDQRWFDYFINWLNRL